MLDDNDEHVIYVIEVDTRTGICTIARTHEITEEMEIVQEFPTLNEGMEVWNAYQQSFFTTIH